MPHQFMSHHYNAIGMIGVVIILAAYLFLQLDRLSPDSVAYSLFNIIGAGFILASLFFAWNLSAVTIEVSWILVSFLGLVKAFVLRYRGKEKNE